MVKGALSALKLDRNWMERILLLRCQHGHDLIHVACQPGLWQKVPAVAAWDIVKAAIFNGAVVKAYPARQVSHGHRARPVGIILMPRYNSAMFCRFAEELIVPETNRPAQQLRHRHHDRWIPKDVMKSRLCSPCAQCMEERGTGTC